MEILKKNTYFFPYTPAQRINLEITLQTVECTVQRLHYLTVEGEEVLENWSPSQKGWVGERGG